MAESVKTKNFWGPFRRILGSRGRTRFFVVLTALVCVAAVVPSAPVSAARLAPANVNSDPMEPGAQIWQVRSIPTAQFGVDRPAGLVFVPEDDSLLILGRNPGGRSSRNLVGRFNLREDAVNSARLSWIPADPINAAFDSKNDRVVLLDDETKEIGLVDSDDLDQLDEAPVVRGKIPPGLVSKAAGIAVDHASGAVFALEPASRQIVRIDPAVANSPANPNGFAGGQNNQFPIAGTGELRGLALDQDSGSLYSLDASNSNLLEFNQEGTVLQTWDVSSFDVAESEAMVFAPSGDPTDDPNRQSLYIVAGGAEDSKVGAVTEISLAPLNALALVPDSATLIATVDGSQLSPPSPDTAGITYLSDVGTLLVSDSEVNEMPIYAGVNLFELTTAGSQVQSGNSLAFSNEPTGVTFNPVNRHIFVSDDDKDEVNEIDPGGDNIYGTGDDSLVTVVDANIFNSTDAEGVALDTLGGNLFIIDGIGREVYRVSAGANGVFEGGGDDEVSNFDLEIHGVADPEGIAFDATRGTILVADRGPDLVSELTISGDLVRIVDISAAGPNPYASGVVLAPGSVSPGDTNLYVTDRGVDNNSDPNENDGLIYELNVAAPAPNAPPYVYAGVNQTTLVGNTTNFAGIVADDSPGVTNSWAQVSGPGQAVLGDPSSVTSTVNFPQIGTYEFELTGNDGTLVATDRMIFDVTSASGPFTVDAQITASSDDAEQRATGSPILSSSDLDLVLDKTRDNIAVGLRWNNLGVPQGASIIAAHVQFKTDETGNSASSLTIEGHAIDNAPTFTTSESIAARPRTGAVVGWSPPPWTSVGEIGPAQRTSDISAVVQEIVDRPGWSAGNSLALILSGSGERVAESFDGSPSGTPSLHIEYTTSPVTPTVSVGVSDGVAGEPGDDGEFTFSRSGSTSGALTVLYLVSGSADPGGLDYVPLLGSVTIPVGQVSVAVPVSVVDDAVDEPDETVVLTVQPDPGYVVAGPPGDSASITITDEDGLVPQILDVRVSASSDDAEERSSGSVSLNSTDLELVEDGTRLQTVGTRFLGVDVPQGAQITSAWIQFQADEVDSVATNLIIRGQDADNAPTFVSTSGSISSRPTTTAQVNWSPVAWGVVGEAGPNQQTPDLAGIIQEIVDRPTWANGNAMVLTIAGTGSRTAESFNGSPAGAPLLHIEFSSEPIPNRPPVAVDDTATAVVATALTIDVTANDTDPDNNLDPSSANTTCFGCSGPQNGQLLNLGTGSFDYTSDSAFLGDDTFVYEVCDSDGLCDQATVTVTVTDSLPQVLEVRVSASADDAEERSTGRVSLTSSDLELVVDGSKGPQLVGMRFVGVNLPAGAIINSASIQFQADETDSVQTDLLIRGQAADNPTGFVNTSGNISSRLATSAQVNWSPAAWTVVSQAGADQQTPDIASIIQEIADRTGWVSGNSVVVMISGTGTRVAESYNGNAAAAPLLHIEYTMP